MMNRAVFAGTDGSDRKGPRPKTLKERLRSERIRKQRIRAKRLEKNRE